MAIFSVRLTLALYRRAFCQVRVSPFNGFSTWRRSSPKVLFDNSALAASAARTEALQDRKYAGECAGGASGPAARSKPRPLQGLQPRARAGNRDEKPVSACVLAGAIANPVKNKGCECGGGRGRITGERRPRVDGVDGVVAERVGSGRHGRRLTRRPGRKQNDQPIKPNRRRW